MTATPTLTVVSYGLPWPQLYETQAEALHATLGQKLLALHHVGSTSIPGLAAKPRIDILGVLEDPKQAIPLLEPLGYEYRGEYNIPLRCSFRKRTGTEVNLHLFPTGHPEIELNLCFRDFLLKNSEAREAYATLKYELIKDEASFKKQNSLFTGYNLGKDAFIRKVLQQAGYQSIRMTKCTHYLEWEAAKRMRNTYFFGPHGIEDPYTWTFDHAQHAHLCLHQGTNIVGYAHVQFWPPYAKASGGKPLTRAALRIIVVEEALRNQGLGGVFLGWIECWLQENGTQRLQTESSPAALRFYRKHGYVDMLFEDPDGYVGDPTDVPVGKIL